MEGNLGRFGIPLLVGFSGKREVAKQVVPLRSALDAFFDLVDCHTAHTPKILMCGLASGGDGIAAEAALARGWRVLAALPLAQELYAQDWSSGEPEFRRLATAFPDRVRLQPLAPLLREKGEALLDEAALTRHEDKPNLERSLHYEQLALALAERCGILIVAIGGKDLEEEAFGVRGRPGGTSRVMMHRRLGRHAARLDPVGRGVATRSKEVPLKSALAANEADAVFWLDLDRLSDDAGPNRANLFQVVEPIRGDHALDPRAASAVLAVRVHRRPDFAKEVLNAAPLTIALEGFNCRICHFRKVEQAPPSEHVPERPAMDVLRDFRAEISTVQRASKKRLGWVYAAMAFLFLAAVASLEIHAKLFSEQTALLGVYFLCIGAAYWISSWAGRKKMSEVTEDYRLVSEALRVQVEWWRIGIVERDRRVDRYLLETVSGPLGMARRATTAIIEAALAVGIAPTEQSQGEPRPSETDEWIETQSRYFKLNGMNRWHHVSRIMRSSWILFGLSIGLIASTLPITPQVVRMVVHADESVSQMSLVPGLLRLSAVALFIGIIVVVIIIGLSREFGPLPHGFEGPIDPPKKWVRRISWASARWWSGLLDRTVRRWRPNSFAWIAMPFGLLVGLSAAMLGLSVRDPMDEHIPHFLKATLIIAAVLFAAAAAAWRYIAEKKTLEAEEHAYAEAFVVYERARAALSAAKEEADPVARRGKEKTIVFETGIEALQEIESWVRAHRQRPMEPVIG